jgi:hypothetical protein
MAGRNNAPIQAQPMRLEENNPTIFPTNLMPPDASSRLRTVQMAMTSDKSKESAVPLCQPGEMKFV